MFLHDNTGTLTIAADHDAGEPGHSLGNGRFLVTRTGGNVTSPLVVNFTVDSSSTAETARVLNVMSRRRSSRSATQFR